MAVFLAVLITTLTCAVIGLFVEVLRTRADYDDLWREWVEAREKIRRMEAEREAESPTITSRDTMSRAMYGWLTIGREGQGK